MKSQDLIIMLKMISLRSVEDGLLGHSEPKSWPSDWEDWEGKGLSSIDRQQWWLLPDCIREGEEHLAKMYSVRNLADTIGISKSVVSVSLNRCIDIGLVRRERNTLLPRVNTSELYSLLTAGAKYFWPARLGEVARGIATAYAAPVLSGKLTGESDLVPIWADARGNTKGRAVEALHSCVPKAIKGDPQLYAYLALIDSIRIGGPRESNLAVGLLAEHLGVKL